MWPHTFLSREFLIKVTVRGQGRFNSKFTMSCLRHLAMRDRPETYVIDHIGHGQFDGVDGIALSATVRLYRKLEVGTQGHTCALFMLS
jgi:hypothetical protein